MAKAKLHEFEKLFQTLTNQMNHIHRAIGRSIMDLREAYETCDKLNDKILPSNFINEIIE